MASRKRLQICSRDLCERGHTNLRFARTEISAREVDEEDVDALAPLLAVAHDGEDERRVADQRQQHDDHQHRHAEDHLQRDANESGLNAHSHQASASTQCNAQYAQAH